MNRAKVRQAIVYWTKVMDSGEREFYDPDYNHLGQIGDLVYELKAALRNDRNNNKS